MNYMLKMKTDKGNGTLGSKNIGNKYLKGSYTVEAAAVISLVFFVLGALLICSFYIHDKSVLQGMVCEAAAAGSNSATEKEQKEAVSSVKKRITASRFMGSKNLSGSVATGEKSTEASWSAVFPVPGFAAKYLTGNKLTIKKEWTSKKFDPAKTIRMVKGAEKLFRIESG